MSLDAQLSHLQDSAEMLTDYPVSRTYKPCYWVVATGARLINGVAGRLHSFFQDV